MHGVEFAVLQQDTWFGQTRNISTASTSIIRSCHTKELSTSWWTMETCFPPAVHQTPNHVAHRVYCVIESG
jgi:hypothetical protein